MSDCIFGVDLGLDGGVAMLPMDGQLPHLWRMPTLPDPRKKGRRIYDVRGIRDRLHAWAPDHVFVEEAQLTGKGPTTKQAVASPARCQMAFEMACCCLGYPCTIVRASTWQRTMFAGLGTVQDTKAASIRRAGQLFPDVNLIPEGCKKPHDGLSDALLLAEYGRRTLTHERTSDGEG